MKKVLYVTVIYTTHAPFSLLHDVNLDAVDKSENRDFHIQFNMFTSRLTGEPIGFTALKLLVIDKDTILTVSIASVNERCIIPSNNPMGINITVLNNFYYHKFTH